jgi:hypothetical protein
MRLRLIRALIKILPRCPCCGAHEAIARGQKLVTQ